MKMGPRGSHLSIALDGLICEIALLVKVSVLKVNDCEALLMDLKGISNLRTDECKNISKRI
jgi:hypothetical protein